MVRKRFQAKNTEMKITTVNKVQFSSLNNKRYNLSDGITSLCFGPLLLLQLRDKKERLFQKYKKQLKKKKTIY